MWFGTPVAVQTGIPAPSRFPDPDESFEVASVKPNTSGRAEWNFDDPPGRIVGTNVLLRDLIRFAYFIYGGDWEIRLAGPDWIKTARFDVDAKAPSDATQARRMSMLRHLLAERFGLKIHYEIRQHPIYALVLARPDRRLGPQLVRSAIDCDAVTAALQAARAAGKPSPFPPAPDKRPLCGSRGPAGEMTAGALTMEQFALHLAAAAGRQVVDKTGLTGRFDWDLRFAPLQPAREGEPPAASGPSMFTALQEQLGLKLEPATGPIEVLVIDRVEAPTPN